MRIRKSIALLAIGALAGLGPAMAQEAAEQEAVMPLAEVLEAHYEALGGKEAWKQVEAVRFTDTMTMGPGMEAPFTMTMQRPDKVRLEFSFQGMTGVQAWDGETAWMVMPFMGRTEPEQMPAEMAEQFEEQADIEGPLFDWEEKGHKVELVARESMEGTDVYTVKVTRENGNETVHYLDSEYFVTIKQSGKRKIQGQEMEIETTVGDYQELCAETSQMVEDDAPCSGDVLIVPLSIESKPKGSPAGQVISITKVEINPEDIDPAGFSMPAKPADEAAG